MATVDTAPANDSAPAAQVRPRRGRWLALVAGAAMVLTACGTIPGAAVEIAGMTLPTATALDWATEVAQATNPQGTDVDPDLRAQTVRGQLTAFIRHQLALDAAKQLGITVTDADINDSIAQYDSYRKQSGAQPLATVMQVSNDMVREVIYDLLVMNAIGKKLPADGADVTDVTVNIDAVPADNWADAVAARVKYTADPAAMTADAQAALAANPGLPGGSESLLQQPHHAMFGIFSAADGEIMLIPNGNGSYLVTRVTDRAESPAKLTERTISAAYQTAGVGGQLAVGSLLLAPQAQDASITVNSRFGRFDPRIVQVVAAP